MIWERETLISFFSHRCSRLVRVYHLIFIPLVTHYSSLILFKGQLLASLVAQMVKRLSAMWETRVRSLGWEDPLEKEMATHSSTLAWRIPWTEEPGWLQCMGSQRAGHDFTFIFTLIRMDYYNLIIKLDYISNANRRATSMTQAVRSRDSRVLQVKVGKVRIMHLGLVLLWELFWNLL